MQKETKNTISDENKIKLCECMWIYDIYEIHNNVGLIDGKYLNLSLWDKKGIMSPPMHALKISFSDCIIGTPSLSSISANNVSFLVILSSNVFVIVNKHHEITLKMDVNDNRNAFYCSKLPHVSILSTTDKSTDNDTLLL